MPVEVGRHALRQVFTAVLQGEEPRLDDSDQEALFRTFRQNAKSISETKPERLAKLQGEIELVTLERLIGRYESMIKKKLSEADWQRLFAENPFILGMVVWLSGYHST